MQHGSPACQVFCNDNVYTWIQWTDFSCPLTFTQLVLYVISRPQQHKVFHLCRAVIFPSGDWAAWQCCAGSALLQQTQQVSPPWTWWIREQVNTEAGMVEMTCSNWTQAVVGFWKLQDSGKSGEGIQATLWRSFHQGRM